MMTTNAPGTSTRIRHLVIGADEHGVVRHGILVARACGADLVRTDTAEDAIALDHADADVIHVPFTDRLFGPTCDVALEVFRRLATRIAAVGASLSVTLHDVPGATDALAARRRATYADVIQAARGVVVNSRLELAAIEDDALNVHSLRCIALPIEHVPWRRRQPLGRDAVVLGFVFPDRGYEQLIAALPPGSGLLALGRASAGHEDLPGKLARLAAQFRRTWQLTGFVTDDQLSARLWAAPVPVAPNPRVTASASIATWIAHGRRPLVPAIDYTRELAASWPGTLRLYDPDDVSDLATALAEALAEPDSTWLADGTAAGPSEAEVAQSYRTHLEACRPERAMTVAGRILVPHNRWDRLPVSRATSDATVTVVIPYFEAQHSLDLVLGALQLQTIDRGRLDVVVADDGSSDPPDLSAADGLRVQLVRQERNGFGAARARNLGARAGGGKVLAFLDADTVPEPDYLEQLIRIPSADRDGLAVGRRRHADLAGWNTADVQGWLTQNRPAPRELAEPKWLRDAYRDSADLLHADSRSYRHVISAVLAVNRSLFERIGGFSEQFHAYGGEDWEFAHRAWLAGALFVHVRSATAWHDGPDWSERAGADRTSVKNAETLALSALLPDPALRGGGQWLPYCRAVVVLSGGDAAGVLATSRTAFAAGVDCGFWLTGQDAESIAEALADPRIRVGRPPQDVIARAGVTIDLAGPADLSDLDALCDLTERLGVVTTPAMTLRSTRARSRCRDADRPDEMAAVLFGRHERSAPRPEHHLDLAHVLARQCAPNGGR
jgi:GT2 family glycosyltransferase